MKKREEGGTRIKFTKTNKVELQTKTKDRNELQVQNKGESYPKDPKTLVRQHYGTKKRILRV